MIRTKVNVSRFMQFAPPQVVVTKLRPIAENVILSSKKTSLINFSWNFYSKNIFMAKNCDIHIANIKVLLNHYVVKDDNLDGQLREAFHSKKQQNLGISPKWWWPPPPLSGVGTFLNLGLYWNGLTPPPKINLGRFELGIFWKPNYPLNIFQKYW